MHYLSLCAIAKGEAHNIREWVLFHLAAGVEHFYIYDNGVVDGTAEAIRSVAELTVCCTIVSWPAAHSQLDAYMHCINAARGTSRWIGFIDLDEFLFCANGADLKGKLMAYEAYPAVVVSWQMFGSGGLYDRPPGLVTKAFDTRAPHTLSVYSPNYIIGQVAGNDTIFWPYFSEVKSIVDPSRVENVISPHSFRYVDSAFPVDENFETIDYYPQTLFARRRNITTHTFKINHYWSKSIKEFSIKLERALADQQGVYDKDWAYMREALMNGFHDNSASIITERIQDDWWRIQHECPLPNHVPTRGFIAEPQNIVAHDLCVVSYEGADYLFNVVDPADAVQASHVAGKFYEVTELEHLRANIVDAPSMTCIDIGSNVGNHAIYFASVMKFARVVCIEPNATAAALLEANIAANGPMPSVDLRYLGIGLSNADYMASVEVPYENNLGSARLVANNKGGSVRCVTGDVLFVREQSIGLIKIDVEGLELPVLDGLRGVIAKWRPDIYIEIIDGNAAEFLACVSRLDYKVIATFQMYEHLKNYHLRSLEKLLH